MDTCETQDGKQINDGVKLTLSLQHGTTVREVKGKVRAFESDGETRWEILTNDPLRPAIGFLPENVLTYSK